MTSMKPGGRVPELCYWFALGERQMNVELQKAVKEIAL